MKRILVLTFVLMLTGWITSCEDQQDPTPDLKPSEISVTAEAQQLIRSGNHFGIELFKQINANQEVDTNTLVSPVSVSLALAMTYNGAAGDTKTAMEHRPFVFAIREVTTGTIVFVGKLVKPGIG